MYYYCKSLMVAKVKKTDSWSGEWNKGIGMFSSVFGASLADEIFAR